VQGNRWQSRRKCSCCRGRARGVEEEVRQEPAEESDLSGTDSESEAEGEEVVWGRSGVNAEWYKKKMVIWKNEIIGKGQKFQSADAFRYSI